LAKPVVDGIEKDLEGKAQVLRLNVLGDVGSQAARRYGVRGLPTLVVVDGKGQAVDFQAGIPDRNKAVMQINQLLEK